MVDWKSIVTVLGMLVGASMLTSCGEPEKKEATETKKEVVIEKEEVKVDTTETVVIDTTKAVEGKVE